MTTHYTFKCRCRCKPLHKQKVVVHSSPTKRSDVVQHKPKR
ncbi:hypothetical protein VPHK408_0256 [Vibrio phage K408]